MKPIAGWGWAGVLIVSLLAGCTGSAPGEFNDMCLIAMQVEKSTEPAQQGAEWARQVNEKLGSDRLENLLKSIATVEPGKKYAMVVAAAKAAGWKEWGCPALERMFGGNP